MINQLDPKSTSTHRPNYLNKNPSNSARKLLVFDSHPVQYRVPVWRAMEALRPGSVHVVYGSDCSVRGHADRDFGRNIAWDDPMLEGYASTILNCERGEPLSGWGSLTGAGVNQAIAQIQPTAILLTGLTYRYDLVAYARAKQKGIPVWLRCETQDEALPRSGSKAMVRSAIYHAAYWGLNRIFYIGELNRRHYRKHGVSEARLRPARYCTVDRFASLSQPEKLRARANARLQAQINPDDFVVGFSGKFIPKKNPDLLYGMLSHLPAALRQKTVLYFLGSGELEPHLRTLAKAALEQFGVRTYLAGFANQSQLAGHYLAMDLLVLPSRRMGETWGLVVNEAMQAGCGVAASTAVGCTADFGAWEGFRVFGEGNAESLAQAVTSLAAFPHSFDWAAEGLKNYTVEATARALLGELDATKKMAEK